MKIIKNILEKTDAEYFYNIVFNNNFFPWYFLNDASINANKDTKKYAWSHSLFEKNPTSNFFNFFELPIIKIIKTFNLDPINMTRARLGLHTSKFNSEIGTTHVDQKDPHWVILYYLNNSDGNTYFYNSKTLKIKPEFNKAIMFDGNIKHASSNPVKTMRRITLNINIKK